MSHNTSNIMKITPSLNEINRENINLKCTEPNCKSQFQNFSNLNLHLIKHHNSKETKMNFVNKNVMRQYYCPYINCIYNINNNKYFKSMKYLRQHYVKVHADKNFGCSKCDKQFGSLTIMRNHEKNCGIKFQCNECGWPYNSREALLTHARRKKHNISVAIEEVNATIVDDDLNEDDPVAKIETISIQTQTIPSSKNDEIINEFLSFGTQTSPNMTPAVETQSTNNLNNLNYFEDNSNISCFNTNQFENVNNLCNIETQTIGLDLDKQLIDNNSMYYSNTYTQTCADILTDLGLNDIQTQTNWNFDSDDLQFVSTETQTNIDDIYNDNFNLLNSSIHTQTSRSIEFLHNISDSHDHDINYNSIHTQT